MFPAHRAFNRHIAFQKTYVDNPSLQKSDKNITRRCVYATVRVENLSYFLLIFQTGPSARSSKIIPISKRSFLI
jgi:hypothetical protein